MSRGRRGVSDYEVKKGKINFQGIRNLARLYKYIKPYSIEYGVGLFFLLITSLASLAFPKLLGDMVSSGSSGGLSGDLNRLTGILVGLVVLQAILAYFRTVLFINVTEKSMAQLRIDTYNHLIRLPLIFFDKHRVGELNSRVSADVALVQDAMATTLANFIRQFIIIIGGVVLLVYTSPKLTLIMLSVVPVLVLITFFFGRYIRKFSKNAQKGVADSNVIVEETLQGIRSVKSYTNELFEIERYRKKVKQVASIGMKSGRYRGLFSVFMIVSLFGSLIVVLWKGAGYMAEGQMNTGELFSFVIYTAYIAGNIAGFASEITTMQKFVGATEDLFELFESEGEELVTSAKDEPGKVLNGSITLENLTFAYPMRPDENVLSSVSMHIESNTVAAVVGHSGAGKSTIASLLLRLYEPKEGQILFDGIPSFEYELTDIRKQIALVPQDVFLFGGTIRENIAYGKPGASEEEIMDAAKKANAWEFIEHFKEGLDTVVGERGTQLSGGQRQRVAIARALLKNPRILILDEATSSLDSESEKLVQDALQSLMQGRTSVVIAHRLSTIKNADVIFVLDGGRLVEQGNHLELVSIENGIYKRLNGLQVTTCEDCEAQPD